VGSSVSRGNGQHCTLGGASHDNYRRRRPATRKLRQSRDSRKTVEAGVKAQDSFDPVLLHDCEVYGVPRGYVAMSEDDLLGALRGRLIDRQNLIHDAEQSRVGGLNCIPAVDSDVAVQYLLQDLGVGNEALAIAHQPFEQSLGIGFVGV